jgi:hypothetical protein
MYFVYFVINPSRIQQECGSGQHTQNLSSYLSTDFVDNSKGGFHG